MKDINLTLCSCNKYLYRNQWKPYKNVKELIAKRIREQLPGARLNFEHLKIPLVHKEEKESEIIAKLKGEEHVVKVILKLSKCNMCAKEGTEYYEAILQVRSPSLKVLEDSVELLKKRVESLRHKGMFINKVKRFNEGYTLYMTNKRIAQALGRELQETYGGIYKASPHLYSRSRQTSKNIYRVNIFARLPGFEKEDIILFNERVFKVEKVGKRIKLLDLEKNSFVSVDYPKLSYHVLKKHVTYVSRIHPELEVINPFDYQSSSVRNKPEDKFKLGQEVNVVVHKGVYVVD